MLQEAVSKDPFALKHCPYRYITQEMCAKSFDVHMLTKICYLLVSCT